MVRPFRWNGRKRYGTATSRERHDDALLAALSRALGINPKTVAKWRKRAAEEEQKTGPKAPRSTTLTEAEAAAVVVFRRHTQLPLDDCLYALQPLIPHLTRSARHRCLERHGISRLPDIEGDKPTRQRFKRYPIGFFHIDIAEAQTAKGKLYLFVGIDRTSKFAVTQRVDKADRRTAWEFFEHLLKAVPYRVHTFLTDNGIQFAERTAAFAAQIIAGGWLLIGFARLDLHLHDGRHGGSDDIGATAIGGQRQRRACAGGSECRRRITQERGDSHGKSVICPDGMQCVEILVARSDGDFGAHCSRAGPGVMPVRSGHFCGRSVARVVSISFAARPAAAGPA